MAFPGNEDPPAKFTERLDDLSITNNIPIEFFCPKLHVALWNRSYLASRMPVPEASMDEDNCLVARQDYVWLSWKSRASQSIPQPQPMEDLA